MTSPTVGHYFETWHEGHDYDQCPGVTPRPAGVEEQTLVLAWLNAMHPEHNAGCNEQGAFDCPVAAEVREFVPKVAREYAALEDKS